MDIWIANIHYYLITNNAKNAIWTVFFIKIAFNGFYTHGWEDIAISQSNSAKRFMNRFNRELF